MLKKAEVPGPYLLVGHSLGGLYIRTFAALHLKDTAGIVLVNAMHEDQRTELGLLAWPKPTILESMTEFAQNHFPTWYYPRYRKQYLKHPKQLPYNQEEWEYTVALQANYKHYMSIDDEEKAIPQSFSELKKLNRNLGNIPLTVITAGQDSRIFDINKSYDNDKDLAYAKIFTQCRDIRFRLQHSVLQHSTQSKQVIAHNSGHNIPEQQPGLVISVIKDMLGEINAAK